MEVTYLEAIRQGISEEMERDPAVFLLGEDIGVVGCRVGQRIQTCLNRRCQCFRFAVVHLFLSACFSHVFILVLTPLAS